jgi:arylsulfatase
MKSKLTKQKPNFILILADDLGFSDIGCYGSEIQTPNLDALAQDGIRFTQMYNCARCCPSRASLLTGLYPHQAGIGHMVSDIGLPGYQGFLNDRCVTIAEVLREGGYHSHLAGKWHVGGYYPLSRRDKWVAGDRRHPRPIDRGFDSHYGTLGGAGSYFNPHTLIQNDLFLDIEQEEFYYTDEISRYAARMIEQEAAVGNPFFLFVSYTAPHWPLHALPEDIEKYRSLYRKGWDVIRTRRHETLKGLGIINPNWNISARDEEAPPWEDITNREWESSRMAVYAAQIDRMDQGIGRILRAIKINGIEDNTLVAFLSDNGGCAEFLREDGHWDYINPLTRDGRRVKGGNTDSLIPGPDDTFMSYGQAWANVSNTPFRLYKHWVHEGGIATPFIVRYPGTICKGSIYKKPVHITDIMSTFIELAEVPYPKDYKGQIVTPFEGESLVAALSGNASLREMPICWEHEGNRAVRMGDWKLVSKYPVDWELYDMANDGTELRDLATENPEMLSKIANIYREWANRCCVIKWDEIRKIKDDKFLSR